jgi:uncharacterized SAM-binding protein YcdF (DUF218 family)
VRRGGRPSTTLRQRVEAAAAFGDRFANPLFVPTGGVGRFPPSEASVMAGLLVARGVPPERIQLEESATDTLSSVRAVAALLHARGNAAPVYAASSDYHLPRCLLLLRLVGVTASACPPPPPPAGLLRRWYWRLREVLAMPYDAGILILLRLFGRETR